MFTVDTRALLDRYDSDEVGDKDFIKMMQGLFLKLDEGGKLHYPARGTKVNLERMYLHFRAFNKFFKDSKLGSSHGQYNEMCVIFRLIEKAVDKLIGG